MLVEWFSFACSKFFLRFPNHFLLFRFSVFPTFCECFPDASAVRLLRLLMCSCTCSCFSYNISNAFHESHMFFLRCSYTSSMLFLFCSMLALYVFESFSYELFKAIPMFSNAFPMHFHCFSNSSRMPFTCFFQCLSWDFPLLSEYFSRLFHRFSHPSQMLLQYFPMLFLPRRMQNKVRRNGLLLGARSVVQVCRSISKGNWSKKTENAGRVVGAIAKLLRIQQARLSKGVPVDCPRWTSQKRKRLVGFSKRLQKRFLL